MASELRQQQHCRGSICKGTYFFAEAERSMEYAIYVPTGYREDTPAPVVILLHGMFSNPHHVIRYRGLTREAEHRGYIVAAPFGFSDRGWYGSLGRRPPQRFHGVPNAGELSERDVLNVLGRVREQYRVDDHRIYLMGHSMGGAGTLHLGAAYPDVWAALAPMSPPVMLSDEALLEQVRRFSSTPVIVITGEKDTVTPVNPVRELVKTMQSFGMDHHYCEVKGGGHGAPALRPRLIKEVFDFFDGRQRSTPAPKRIELSTFEVHREQPSDGQVAGVSSSEPQKAQLRQHQSRPWLQRVFSVLGHLQRQTMRVELAGWSFLYCTKDVLSGLCRGCHRHLA